MRLRQINLNKSKLGNISLCQIIKHDLNTIYLVQEPYFYKGKIPGLPKGYSFFGDSKSRAIIIAPSCMPLFLCHELTHTDTTVCLYDNGKDKKYLASMYLDINKEVITQNVENIFEILQDLQVPAVFGLDSNAHSTFWGCESSNQRGEVLEDFIMHYNLSVLNVGHHPTWQSSRYSSIIDITLTMGNNSDVHGWHISDKVIHSDHFMLEMYFFDKKISPTMIKKVNWDAFQSNLCLENKHIRLWTPVTIEAETAALTKAMTNALAKSSFSVPLKRKDAMWWNDDLNLQYKKVNQLWREKQKSPNKAALYLAEKKHFLKNVRKAKRKSWKSFCNQINDPNSMISLNRIVKNGVQTKIGLLKNKDGKYARTINESIDILMESHFKRSVQISQEERTVQSDSSYFVQKARFCSSSDLKHSFITEAKVVSAINSFGSFKCPGQDNLRPYALKQFVKDKVGLKRLTNLLRAIIELSFTPSAWLEAKIAFLPKPGKSDYSEPKSFRPISLLSFLFKTVERLVYWEMEETVLKDKPLCKSQHAYSKGRSTETALSSLVDRIESSIFRGQLCLTVGLDCSGAFDNLEYDDMITALKERNTPSKIVAWYKNFLYNRRAKVTLVDVTSIFQLKVGTCQGGLLSSLLWCLCFQGFAKLFENTPVYPDIYADDSCITITGCSADVMVDQMQVALNTIQRYGKDHNLNFNPDKTTATFFYRKRNFRAPKMLKLNGKEIPYSSTLCFLGIQIDSRLSWVHHINDRIKKARGLFMKIRNAIGTYWGPSPLALQWGITGILIPMLTYSSIIWSRVCSNKTIMDKLRRLHRLMLSTMMPIRRSTPSRSLEVMLNMVPLHLKIRENALCGMLRVLPDAKIRWDGLGKSKQLGHLAWGKKELSKMGITNFNFDKTKVTNINRNFIVDIDSFQSGKPDSNIDLKCYSDGSKYRGHTGYGFTITSGLMELESDNGYLGTQSTVFQAEITAISKCAEAIMEEPAAEAIIYSDSQAALKALVSLHIKHKSVQKCISVLNEVSLNKSITLAWVKAHAEYPGNERADNLAKMGTTRFNMTVDVPYPVKWAKSLIAENTHKTWNQEWWDYPHARQTKIWFPYIKKKISKGLIKLSRQELGLLVQLLTGHNRLRYHSSKIDPSLDPTCRKCREEAESTWHVLGDCPSLMSWRLQSFNCHFLDNIPDWDLAQFRGFVAKAKLAELNKGEDPDLSIH